MGEFDRAAMAAQVANLSTAERLRLLAAVDGPANDALACGVTCPGCGRKAIDDERAVGALVFAKNTAMLAAQRIEALERALRHAVGCRHYRMSYLVRSRPQRLACSECSGARKLLEEG